MSIPFRIVDEDEKNPNDNTVQK